LPTVLVTGANRGIGLEFVRQYLRDGWRVHAACRDPRSAKDLTGLRGDILVHALDVADHAAVEDLAADLRREAIDLLINNAGVYGPRSSALRSLDYEEWAEVFRVNVMAALKVSESFLDHVARSDLKRVAALTSKMGSMTDNRSGGSYIYRSSKAALNAVMKSLAVDLAPRGVLVAILHPGWVRTDMGGPGALIEAEVSVSGMREVISSLTPETSGAFFNYDGSPIPW
jgi:NAD(P)-dependent dehydrogenase (short-subunit alcohol dehydrogenase family)